MTEIDFNSLDFKEIIKSLNIFIDRDLCNGCGLCGEICPFGLPKPSKNGKFEITNANTCTECSACKRNCPTQAIIMQEQPGCGCLWNVRSRVKNQSNQSNQSCNCS
ncbi:MAG: ATP-binding protein [Candidatus Hodarchaeota archaeon]